MKYKIELDLNIDVNGEMNLDDTELYVLVGNVFDNAVEASKKIAEDRKIWVHFSYKKGYLCFLVKNRYNGRIQGECRMIFSKNELDVICQYAAPTKEKTLEKIEKVVSKITNLLTRSIVENTARKLEQIPEPECSRFIAGLKA